jgi:hypothetical protein
MSARVLSDLAFVFGEDLDRPSVRIWLGDGAAALRAPHTDVRGALVTAARMLRSSDCGGRARERLREWLVQPFAGAAPAAEERDALFAAVAADVSRDLREAEGWLSSHLRAGEGAAGAPPGWVWTLLLHRDDVESVMVLAGQAALHAASPGAAQCEEELLALVSGLDHLAGDVGVDLGDPLRRALPPPAARWLARMAEIVGGAWWLDVVLRHALAAGGALLTALQDRPPPSPEAERPPLAVPRRVATHPLALLMGTHEPGGIDRILEAPPGATLATFFDGEVEVFGVGLGDDEGGAPGLVVRQVDDDLERIEAVELDPPGPQPPYRSRIDLAVWVPLAGMAEAQVTLVVSYRRGETVSTERLALVLL